MISIRDQILGGERKKELSEKDLIEMHHDFLVCYGWIPLEEFVSIPTTTLFDLNTFVQEEKRKREEFRLVLLKFAGVKHPK